METIEYKTIDKSNWPSGPWDNEPDKIQFEDDDTKFPCLIVRSNSGALCGYVGVKLGHPLYGVYYNNIKEEIVVHGGLSYSDFCDSDGDESRSICHVNDSDDSRIWWLGFDCARFQDWIPRFARSLHSYSASYKDIDYLKSELKNLASQLKCLGEKNVIN